MPRQSPIDIFIKKQGALILDGGLATELEARDFLLDTDMWSAQLLKDHPEAIRDVHLAYLKSGADCIATASYQASISGFIEQGLSEQEAENLIIKSVALAVDARDEFLSKSSIENTQRLKPIIAGSIGPYGAMLADGSEYRGDYGVSEDDLRAFHQQRWEILVNSEVDIIAFETIPSFAEAEVLLGLLKQSQQKHAWISFSCQDGKHISDGTEISKCASICEQVEQVTAIGVNCTQPKYIPSLIEQIREHAPTKHVIVYPNSGEVYDPETRAWVGTSDMPDCAVAADLWYKNGARLIGGCCRITPGHIKAMRETLIG